MIEPTPAENTMTVVDEPLTNGTLIEAILKLPRRRGVVKRDNGRIEDFYGKPYVRMRDGSLRRAA